MIFLTDFSKINSNQNNKARGYITAVWELILPDRQDLQAHSNNEKTRTIFHP